MIDFETSEFPVVVANWHGLTSREDVDAYVVWLHAQIAEAATKQKKLIVVAETKESSGMNANIRSYMNEKLEVFSPAELDVWLAPFMVVHSSLMRGLVKALTWISKGSSAKIMSRLELFASREEAIKEAHARLASGARAAS